MGSQVLVTGRVRYYGPGGSLQLEISEIRAEGPGERHLRFLELKERLREQGYFDETAKRPLPERLTTVGIATAADGAVIHDIEVTVKNSGIPFALRLYPTQVQGRGARDAIVRSLEYINREGVCDVIILARGGGSLESLAVFSSEEVVKAVFASGIPVIAAIGHETFDTDASPEAVKEEDLACERAILAADRFQVELMDNLDQLPATGAIIFIAYPRIEGATGLPVRAWAVFE